jgi:hypothetical protein
MVHEWLGWRLYDLFMDQSFAVRRMIHKERIPTAGDPFMEPKALAVGASGFPCYDAAIIVPPAGNHEFESRKSTSI